jgi:hypothetical protein
MRLQRGGRKWLHGFLANGGVVPFHVVAERAYIEQVAGNVLELVTGKGHLKPCERKQNDKTCPIASSRRVWSQDACLQVGGHKSLFAGQMVPERHFITMLAFEPMI